MFGTVGTLLCMLIVGVDGVKQNNIKNHQREEAKREQNQLYFDGRSFRSTETDEKVIHRCGNDKDLDIGVNSGTVYHTVDHAADTEKRISQSKEIENQKNEKSGKMWIWKRFPSWDRHKRKHNIYGWAKIDKVNGMPIFEVRRTGNGYEICYARQDAYYPLVEQGKIKTRQISREEYLKYR